MNDPEIPTRAQQRLQWTRSALAAPALALEPASSDASFRSYWRTGAVDGARWIVMDAPPDREDLAPWLDVARRLRDAGLSAPDVRTVDREHGFVLMSDLGIRTYLPELSETTVDRLYGDALDALLRLQRDVDTTGLPPYDEQRLVAEMELLPTWFLQRHLGVTPDCETWDEIESPFRALATNALVQPKVFVHRDYHSRNLLVLDAASPGIIDFQDAVRGPITYDLVSLLRDCYIAWPDSRVYDWAEGFRRRAVDAGLTEADAAQFRRWFDLTGVQRHVKVLGIFCRLWYRDGKPQYLRDLPLVWRYLRDVGSRYEQTRPLVGVIADALRGRDMAQPRDAAA